MALSEEERKAKNAARMRALAAAMSPEEKKAYRLRRNAQARARNAANPDKVRERNDKYRAKPGNREKIRAQQREFREENRERLSTERREAYAANPEKERERARKYYEKNPEKARSETRRWSEKNREYVREKSRAWGQANRDKVRENTARRRARKAEAGVGPTAMELFLGLPCGLCGEDIDESLKAPDPMSKSVGHIVPLARGGSHTQDNLRWEHLRCNIRKKDRLDSEVADWFPYLAQQLADEADETDGVA